MHKSILSDKQFELLPLIKKFSDRFGMVGGTAIALHLGHRRSIDFDLFTFEDFDNLRIREKIKKSYKIKEVLFQSPNQLSVVVEDAKITFYKYPYEIEYSDYFDDIIKIPDLLTLAAMKAFALGQRAKWKDYVDLYFVFKKYSLPVVVEKTYDMFGSEFNEKLFREQLSYLEDVDYSETVEYMPGFNLSDEAIKKELAEISLQK
jgi:hypothetical protein